MEYPESRVKRLPLEEAVKEAANQNFDCDTRKGLGNTEDDRTMYLDEARFLLAKHGQNYDPEFDDHHLVVVAA